MQVSKRVNYWDGDSFVIVTKNCSKEQAKKMLYALAEADIEDIPFEPSYAEPIEEPIEEYEIPADIRDELSRVETTADDMAAYNEMEPMEEQAEEEIKQEEFRFVKGRYAGKSPADILKEESYKGFANLAFMKTRIKDEAVVNQIEGLLRNFFRNQFEKVKDPYKFVAKKTAEEARNFFKYFGGIITDEDKKVFCEQTGSLNFEAFLDGASLEQLRSAEAAVIEKYAV